MNQPETGAFKAFVAGATGYTGSHLVKTLREKGLAVAAHIRPDSPVGEKWAARFTEWGAAVDRTPWDEAALTAGLAVWRPTVIFAVLGSTRVRRKAHAKAGGDPARADYQGVEYGLTVRLLRAALAAGIAPLFVYLSALGVKPTLTKGYFGARAKAEAEIKASGLPYLIARPSFISGPDREESRPDERLGALTIDGLLALAGALGATRLRDRYRSLTGDQLARALVNAALMPGAKNRTLETDALRELIGVEGENSASPR